jgi:hypothetical protein
VRPKQAEHPDRLHVRVIYAAQAMGFPIHDLAEFEAYRAALTSLAVMDAREWEVVLHPLAARAQNWIDTKTRGCRDDRLSTPDVISDHEGSTRAGADPGTAGLSHPSGVH